MNGMVDFALLEQPARRRYWLLYKALECVPLDRAVDLARMADEFVMGPSAELTISDAPDHPAPLSASSPHANEEALQLPIDNAPHQAPALLTRPRLALSAEQREHLLDRLARGAKNAELAAELGLSPKQVHGVRMGSAREIAKRRERLTEAELPDHHASAPSATVDEVVRYLRQQDDVVVPQEDGEFLVNGRFRLALAELISRANRMRARQGKTEFDLGNGQLARSPSSASANGHPIFWSERASQSESSRTTGSG